MRFSVAVVCLAILSSCQCGTTILQASLCREDSDCAQGLLCESAECVPASTKKCSVVIDGNPILQPSPYSVGFGALDVADATQRVTLHSIGNCTLTLFEATLKAPANTPFSTDLVNAKFPIEIFPGRSREFEVRFTPTDVGRASADLIILSDDKEFPELRVPLSADFRGVPDLRASPSPTDFGYVAVGRTRTRLVQVVNRGTGVAEVEVTAIALDPIDTMNFTVESKPTLPLRLKPLTLDSTALAPIEVTYTPRTPSTHGLGPANPDGGMPGDGPVSLVLTSSKGLLRVPLLGSSATPPKLSFNPPTIDLGQVPLGVTKLAPLTVLNEGGAPMTLSYVWGGPNPSTDLSLTPPGPIPNIDPGTYRELNVAFTATALGQVSGLLTLNSNDPQRPSVTIPVNAVGVPGAGPEVVKIEMSYDNGADGTFDKDLRNVDLTLEHPFGFICNKSTPAPMTWGSYGKASWLAFPPKEEPERIILTDAMSDGTYKVNVSYIEDCKSIPTGLLAGLLGIGIEGLADYIFGGLVPVNGEDIAKLIANICLDRSSSNATVRVFVNGMIVREKTVGLGRKGDTVPVLDLVRSNGRFGVP